MATKPLNNSTRIFLLQKLTVPQIVKKFHAFYGTRSSVVCITVGSKCQTTRRLIATDFKPSYSLCSNPICCNNPGHLKQHDTITEPACTLLLWQSVCVYWRTVQLSSLITTVKWFPLTLYVESARAVCESDLLLYWAAHLLSRLTALGGNFRVRGEGKFCFTLKLHN